tara:strand:+ start:32670 stop:32939 length:270 start_codon:yes stop_codon:yes gene_type:complete
MTTPLDVNHVLQDGAKLICFKDVILREVLPKNHIIGTPSERERLESDLLVQAHRVSHDREEQVLGSVGDPQPIANREKLVRVEWPDGAN